MTIIKKLLTIFSILVSIALFDFFSEGCSKEKKTQADSSKKAYSLKSKKILMIIAPGKFRDEELNEPKDLFEKGGAIVTIASQTTGEFIGMLEGKATATLSTQDVKVADYDAIIFVGGIGASVYFNDDVALKIAKNAAEQGKIIGAICIAPSILANAGILKGKKATSWSDEKGNLQANGAIYVDKDIVTDGKIITANGPQAAKKFGEEIINVMSK